MPSFIFKYKSIAYRWMAMRFAVLMMVVSCTLSASAQTSLNTELPDEIPVSQQEYDDANDVQVDEFTAEGDSIKILNQIDVPTQEPYHRFADYESWETRDVEYNPDPTRAVWMSALCPGLGQVYNRRYWKLPILVGGYMGLAYATSWNNTMLTDYTRAYRDIMDTDPTTKSYMDFFPPTVKEEDLDKAWLTKVLQSRKNFFRRNRDLCIISMIGVYLLAMVDAYVDASLSHFDISTDLSLDLTPTLIPDARGSLPSVGLQWAFNF